MTDNEYTFTMSTDGSITGEKYRGSFKIKMRLSHRDTLRMNGFRRELLGTDPNPDLDALATAKVFSKIWTHLMDAPSWWKESGNGLDLEDEEPVMEILEVIQKKEEELAKARAEKAGVAKNELQEAVKST